MTSETKILLSIGIITFLILGAGIFFFTKNTPISAPQSVADAGVLIRDDSHKIATKSATITLVEFGDYQCPSCAAAHTYVKQILSKFPANINYVFRNFPLNIHQNALIGAEAAEAAGAQGKYWQMSDTLYDKQTEWGESSNPMEFFMKYAADLKLDTTKFKQDINNNQYNNFIQKDLADGNAIGVNATPTFFINNQLYTSSYTDLPKTIETLVTSITPSP